jgi:archaellum biogenesis ATPase FlaH
MLESLLPKTEHLEKRIITYLINHPSNVENFKIDWFVISEYKIIYKAIYDIVTNDKNFDLVLLLEYIRKDIAEYDSEKLNNLILEYKDDKFGSITETGESLKNSWLKLKSLETVETIIEQVSEKNDVDYDTINNCAESLLDNMKQINDDRLILTGADLASRYMDALIAREEGVTKRSFGLKTIDDKLSYPAPPGCYSLLVGRTGSGKSIVKRVLENGLLYQDICVLSIDLEMPLIPNMDRQISMKLDIPIDSLLDKDKPERLKKRLDEELAELESKKNYLYVEHPSIDLKTLDSIIYKSKMKFRDQGILPEDEYMVVIIDLITMIKEFSGTSGSDLDDCVNKLNALCKKHKVHIMGVAQANETKLRQKSSHFKSPDEIDKFQINLEDIKGGSALAERSRIAFSLFRPLDMKKLYFPALEEELSTELDLIHFNLIKKNLEKDYFSIKFKLLDNFRLHEYREREQISVRS